MGSGKVKVIERQQSDRVCSSREVALGKGAASKAAQPTDLISSSRMSGKVRGQRKASD